MSEPTVTDPRATSDAPHASARPRRPGRPGGRARGVLGAVVLTFLLPALVGACAPSAPASGGPASVAPSVVAPEPSATAWPGNVPDAVIALGKLDEQMAIAANAMDDAVTAEDFAALSAASKGLVDLMDGSAENIATVQGYPGTRAVGDAYAAAAAKIRAGAQAIVDGVAVGDATAINGAVAELSEGIAAYGIARKDLGPLIQQAISMKRMLVK